MHDVLIGLAIFGGMALVVLLAFATWNLLSAAPSPDQEALDEQHRSAMPYDSMYVSGADKAPRKSASPADTEPKARELPELMRLATQPVAK